MSANPHANGGLLLRDLELPDFRDYAVDGRRRPATTTQRGDPRARRLPARRDRAPTPTRFRIIGPDETASNRLGAVFEVDRPRLGRRDGSTATTTSPPTAA